MRSFYHSQSILTGLIMKKHFKLAVVVLTVACLSLTASARRIEDWPYERLFKEADLVVIADTERTAETKDRLKTDWKVEFLGLDTTFMVRSTLKGKAQADTITLLHYRSPEGPRIENGPLLVSIRTEPSFAKGEGKKEMRTEYLLFLRVRPDGRFEPVSGQIDPALSVRELQTPDSFLVGKDRK